MNIDYFYSFSRFCICTCFVFLAVSCQKKKEESVPSSVKKAYDQQKAAKSMPLEVTDNEFNESDLIIEPSYKIRSEWKRQAYESNQEWLERLQAILEQGYSILDLDELYLGELSKEKESVIAEIQKLRTSNNSMEGTLLEGSLEGIAKLQQPGTRQQSSQLPFLVHLVKPGDTLYSIAMKYYQSGEMVDEILSWNQAWIRHSDEIVAGMGLVLFVNDTTANMKTVNDQIKKYKITATD
jgi:hypothetical protein